MYSLTLRKQTSHPISLQFQYTFSSCIRFTLAVNQCFNGPANYLSCVFILEIVVEQMGKLS